MKSAHVKLALERCLFTIATVPTNHDLAHVLAEFVCPTLGCGTVIRKHLGLHSGGEPMVWIDAQGQFVRCPGCRVRIPWPPVPDPDPMPDLPTAA